MMQSSRMIVALSLYQRRKVEWRDVYITGTQSKNRKVDPHINCVI